MKKYVLLIDDSVTIHRVIDLSIDTDKYEVTKVFSKEDAALKLTEKLYDFVLLDNKLDNIVITEYIPFLKSRSVGCRVILLVGAFDKFSVSDLEKSGADDYLVKPFDTQSLNSKLSSAGDAEADDSDIREDEVPIFHDNGEGVMEPNFVDGLAIADAMREESHTGKSGKPKPVTDGISITTQMLSGTQYLASLETEEHVAEDDEGYHKEEIQITEENAISDEDELSAMLDLAETDEMQQLVGDMDPAATIHDDGDITSEEASALEFLENENMKAIPATEDDIDNAQYAEDTLVGLEYMDPVISGDNESVENDEHNTHYGTVAEWAEDENSDHINNEQEIARIYGLDDVNSDSEASINDFGLTAESYDTLPFDDTEESVDDEAAKDDGVFDEFEQCLDVMGADIAEDEFANQEQPSICNNTQFADAPSDEASGAGEESQPQQQTYTEAKTPAADIAPRNTAEHSPSIGGITVTISREEIIALIGQSIDKRFLEETIKTVLAENLREVIRTIVPAIAEKYIKEEIERLKDE